MHQVIDLIEEERRLLRLYEIQTEAIKSITKEIERIREDVREIMEGVC